MAVSRDTGHRQQQPFWKRVFTQLTRDDVLLTAIPLLFATAIVAHLLLAVPYLVAVGTGSLLSAAVVADALFLNPPVEGGSS